MAEVSLRKIVKEYDGGVQAVKGIDLDIADDEFVEITPKSLRLRKKVLQSNRRPRKNAIPAATSTE